ncbi:MAG TPA: hypothetical protein VHB02_06070 [Acidimicrobiales bacterium]|nr:hypothetical protein [Acidimicrobiales bacterium]
MADPLSQAWAALDIANLRDSLDRYSAMVTGVVHRYGTAAAALAAHYYEAERAAAGIPGSFRVKPARPAGLDQVTEAVHWATKGLWTSHLTEEDIASARSLTEGLAEKYALDAGRITVIHAVHADRKATGWARVTEPGACSFCLLLAIRGAVYRSERSAGFDSHDHCHCHVQPIFGAAYEPSAEVRRAEAIYRGVRTTPGGPKAVRNAFRAALAADQK